MSAPFTVARVLAPTDLTEPDLSAIRYARLFASHFEAKVTILYSDPLYPGDYAPHTAVVFPPPSTEQEAKLREEIALHVGPAMDAYPFDIEVALGHPVSSILGAAANRGADLIVVGSHMRHGWRRALIGSVSEGVLEGSRCPVITVARDDLPAAAAARAVTRILCPVNFSEVARDALHAAARVANAFGAELVAVHVIDQFEAADVDGDERTIRQWVDPELRKSCTFRELVVRGGPAERVLDCAEDLHADLLVVGARRRLFRDQSVVGTTTERIVRFAMCPVLVIPRVERKAERAERGAATRPSAQ